MAVVALMVAFTLGEKRLAITANPRVLSYQAFEL